jgi:hypothetical protein
MKQILTLSTFLTIGSLGSLHVFANTTPLVSVEHQNFSPGCGPVSYEIAPQPDYNDGNRNVRGESLRLFFSNFYLQADRPGDYLRTCDIDAKIIVPAGYRFMPVRAQAEGFYDIRPEGRNTGGVKVSYSVQPGDLHALRTNPNPFTGSGDIHCKADLENPKFTACFNRPTEVTLSTHLAMWLNHQVDGFSTIQLDASRRNQNLFWNWQLQSCENYFDQKQFHSSYVAYDGNTYSARISIDGYQGTYQSEAGFTGTLSNLTYSDDGLSISGNWSTSNAQGYFSFSILDVGEGRFHGIWGDDKGYRNDWTGQYVQEDVPQREYHSFFKADTGECLDSMGVFNSGAPCLWSHVIRATISNFIPLRSMCSTAFILNPETQENVSPGIRIKTVFTQWCNKHVIRAILRFGNSTIVANHLLK